MGWYLRIEFDERNNITYKGPPFSASTDSSAIAHFRTEQEIIVVEEFRTQKEAIAKLTESSQQ